MSEKPVVVDCRVGGQVFRTAIGLSALISEPVELHNIRANRPNPGLQAQHLTALELTAKLCNATVKGNQLGSQRVWFEPKKTVDSQCSVGVQTAGSVSLVLQSAILQSLVCSNRLRVSGGTHVPFAPPIEFVSHALFPLLKKIGARFELDLKKPGFFPQGGGLVSFESEPATFPLKKTRLVKSGQLLFIDCFSISAGLPSDIVNRQVRGARQVLAELGIDMREHVHAFEKASSVGTSVVLLAHLESGGIVSATALGKKGVPAETIGKKAGEWLLSELKTQKPVDGFLADQLVPFLALAKGTSVIACSNLDLHALENLNVCKQLLDCDFVVTGKQNEPAEISVDGIGWKDEFK